MAEKKITANDLLNGIKGWSAADMLKSAEEFLKNVEADEYQIVPTWSAFADSIGQSRADVHEWLRLHPTESKQMTAMLADTITSGAMLNKYKGTTVNFALKNLCGWEEAPSKKSQTSKESADEKKAQKLLDEYIASERRKAIRAM